MLRSMSATAALGLLLMTSPAWGGDGGDGGSLLGLGLKAIVQGKAKPAIILRPRAELRRLTVDLERSDGVKTHLKSGRLRQGKVKELRFKQPVGIFTYKAHFKVVWKDGVTSDFKTTFSITRVGKLKLKMGPGDVDMEARTLRFRITNPAKEATLTILGTHGKHLDQVLQSYESPAPGTELTLAWPAQSEEILRLDLKVTDVAGFYAGMQVTPFTIDIPHEEVEFATGSASIPSAEEPKLTSTLGQIQKALATHGTLLALRLYIGGCTDTVGGKSGNRALSERRARSIAQWFRAHGVDIPTHYKGYGEERLAVPTPDETEEARNRRAEYVLSPLTPPDGGWKRL